MSYLKNRTVECYRVVYTSLKCKVQNGGFQYVPHTGNFDMDEYTHTREKRTNSLPLHFVAKNHFAYKDCLTITLYFHGCMLLRVLSDLGAEAHIDKSLSFFQLRQKQGKIHYCMASSMYVGIFTPSPSSKTARAQSPL